MTAIMAMTAVTAMTSFKLQKNEVGDGWELGAYNLDLPAWMRGCVSLILVEIDHEQASSGMNPW